MCPWGFFLHSFIRWLRGMIPSAQNLNAPPAIFVILMVLLTPQIIPLLVMAQNKGDIRLIGMDSRAQGRVEVFYNNEWGTICDYNYEGAASTICYQLNFTSPPSSHDGRSVKELSKSPKSRKVKLVNISDDVPIHFRDVDCGPIYSNPQSVIHLLRCNYVELDLNTKCTHFDDLVVFCEFREEYYENPYPSEVRLVKSGNDGGNITFVSTGTLEIYLNNRWGNVCYMNFSNTAANTTCQQLGYTHAIDISWTNVRTTDMVWFDKVSCGSKSYSCLNSCFEQANMKNTTCIDGHYAVLTCSFDPKLMPKSISGNPTMCKLMKKYSDVPAYFISIMCVVSLLWLLAVTIIMLAAICHYMEKCPSWKRKTYDFKTD